MVSCSSFWVSSRRRERLHVRATEKFEMARKPAPSEEHKKGRYRGVFEITGTSCRTGGAVEQGRGGVLWCRPELAVLPTMALLGSIALRTPDRSGTSSPGRVASETGTNSPTSRTCKIPPREADEAPCRRAGRDREGRTHRPSAKLGEGPWSRRPGLVSDGEVRIGSTA